MQVIQTSTTVVTCRGGGTTAVPKRGVRRLNLLCSNGTSAEATLGENLTVGNVFSVTLRERQQDVAVCRGNYFKSGSKDGPFIVRCVDFNRTRMEEIEVRPRVGAAEVTSTGGTGRITVWIQP